LQRDVLFFLPHVSQQATAPEKTYTLGRHRKQNEKKERLMWTLLTTPTTTLRLWQTPQKRLLILPSYVFSA
jgi:hypothetical protein